MKHLARYSRSEFVFTRARWSVGKAIALLSCLFPGSQAVITISPQRKERVASVLVAILYYHSFLTYHNTDTQ